MHGRMNLVDKYGNGNEIWAEVIDVMGTIGDVCNLERSNNEW